VEKRETEARGAAEVTVLRGLRATIEGLEMEEMARDCSKVRGDLWVSRLNAEHEADIIRGEKEDAAILK
jgi:hypothetical protein